ncbi:MAG: HipA domain-containing protein [Elusimicrobiota bacterium]|nr:HipA domain-containing protein [Elusimicrobiota bacterium]
MPCLQKLFAMRTLPSFDFGVSDILSEIIKIDGRMSISGVQPKISLRLNREKNVLEIIAENGEYILKPQTQSIKNLPENEQLCMTLADIAGFSSPPHALIRLKDNTFAYIVKRFDRKDGAKIHQEDFQQILALNINDKYQGSYEKIGKAIKNISTVPGLDLQFFYERILFYFMIGNGDAHAKNFSMQYFDDGQRRLSPVYDIVSSRLAIPEEKEETALALNGKRNNITLSDFSSLSQYLNILQVAKINNTLLDMKDDFINTINAYKLFSFEIRKRFKEVIRSRISALNKQI